MSNISFARRYWDSLTGAEDRPAPLATGRGRDGYSFWQRYWASLTGADLPVLKRSIARNSANDRAYEPSTQVRSALAGQSSSGWFQLPVVHAPAVLLAASNEHVVAEVTAANRIVEMTVRRYDSPMRYRLEVVLRGADALPAVVSVRYGSPESQRLLLVPLDRQEFGPPSGLIDLPDFGAGIPWEVSGPLHVESDTSWSAEILTASVRTAVTVATRDAWRRVRNIVSDEMGRIIDEALT